MVITEAWNKLWHAAKAIRERCNDEDSLLFRLPQWKSKLKQGRDSVELSEQETKAQLSSSTEAGDSGTIYTLNIGAMPFARLTLTSGLVGSSVSIFGQGFSSSSLVKFDGVQATGVTRQGTTYITVPVPSGALTGNVTVTTGSTTLTSNQIFKVTPKLKSFTPSQGPVGTSVVIKGVSLTQTTKVTFGSVKTTNFTVDSDIQIAAIVPTGAKTGKVVVTTKGGLPVAPLRTSWSKRKPQSDAHRPAFTVIAGLRSVKAVGFTKRVYILDGASWMQRA
jgi:hypothetical protein